MSFFGLGKAVTVDVTFAGGDQQRSERVKSPESGQLEILPSFHSGETVAGHVHLSPAPGKAIDHLGIKCEILGQCELYFDRGNAHEFVSLVREMKPPGELRGPLSIPFEFSRVELPYESYRGINARVRYFVRVTVQRGFGATVVAETPFLVRIRSSRPGDERGIKMEVGIEDCLPSSSSRQEQVPPRRRRRRKIFFLLVRIKIRHVGGIGGEHGHGRERGQRVRDDREVRVMDGAPVRGEHRSALPRRRSHPDVQKRRQPVGVQYYLNLVLS